MPELYTGGDLAPRNLIGKMALGIWSRVRAALFNPKDAPAPLPDRPDPDGAEGSLPRMMEFWTNLRRDLDRFESGRRSWLAYQDDERLSAAMDGLAEHATAKDNEGRVFRLTLAAETPDPLMQARFEELEYRAEKLGLEKMAESIVLRTCLEGDSYLSVTLNADMDSIAEVCVVEGAREGKLMKKMRDRVTKEFGGWALFDKASGDMVGGFAPWEIVQVSRKRVGNYGIPMLKSGRMTFEQIQRLEESMVRAMETRAYAKNVHKHPGVSKEKLDQLLAEHVDRVKKFGRGVDTDIFTSGEVDVIDPGNAQLANIAPTEYLERKMLTGTRTPPGLLGHNVANRAVLDKQEEVFVRMLSGISGWVSEAYREILDLQLILMGVLPEDVPYKLVWTDKSSEDLKQMADAMAILVNDCKLDPITAQEEAGFDPEVTMARWEKWNEWQAEMDRKSGQEPPPRGTNGNGGSDGNGNDGAVQESWLAALGGRRRNGSRHTAANAWSY